MTQIGIMIEGQDGLNWERWGRILQTAEDGGYQCVFRSDHYTNASGPLKDALELWTSLTYAALMTKRIEFGPLVSPVTFRQPAMTIKHANDVHTLSGGRLILGVGAGWQEREHRMFGVPFYDFKTRYEQLTEQLEMMRRLFRTAEPVTFEGTHFQLEEAVLYPRPVPAEGPRFLIGGNGPQKTLPLVAQYADEWNAVYPDHATYAERAARLDELLIEQGRQPRDVKRSLMTRVIFGVDDASVQRQLAAMNRSAEELTGRGLIVGTASAVTDQIGRWAELGVQRFMLQWLDQDDIAGLEAMARDVLPHFHTA